MPTLLEITCRSSYIFLDCIVVADADARDKGSDTESSSEEDKRKVCSYLHLQHSYFVGDIVFTFHFIHPLLCMYLLLFFCSFKSFCIKVNQNQICIIMR